MILLSEAKELKALIQEGMLDFFQNPASGATILIYSYLTASSSKDSSFYGHNLML